jgi:hypothetical protein
MMSREADVDGTKPYLHRSKSECGGAGYLTDGQLPESNTRIEFSVIVSKRKTTETEKEITDHEKDSSGIRNSS